jgi:hypothetical protein
MKVNMIGEQDEVICPQFGTENNVDIKIVNSYTKDNYKVIYEDPYLDKDGRMKTEMYCEGNKSVLILNETSTEAIR